MDPEDNKLIKDALEFFTKEKVTFITNPPSIVFGSPTEKRIMKKYEQKANEVVALEEKFAAMSDDELKAKSDELFRELGTDTTTAIRIFLTQALAVNGFPFEIKRVYYIWGTAEKVVRGKHAHKKLEQVIVCTSGSCDFILDNGREREVVRLDNPAQGLHIKNNIWREFTNFSKDCVVMVLASEHYNEEDYIRDYEMFLKEVNK